MTPARQTMTADAVRGGETLVRAGSERAMFIGGLMLWILSAVATTGLVLTIPNW